MVDRSAVPSLLADAANDGVDILSGTVALAALALALANPTRRNKKFLRGEIASQIDLKFAPDIRFRADQSFDSGARIDALLNSPQVKRDLTKSVEN